jgi:hypothetical protein
MATSLVLGTGLFDLRRFRSPIDIGVATDNAEGFKQGAKFGESALSKQAEGTLLKTLLC